MLTTPAFTTIRGVTVFPDDEVWYKFYPVPQHPTVRRDENGDPVFLLVKYAFSDADRENDPNLPAGGGYLNFDVVFDLDPDVEAEVVSELQAWVDEEWERRRGGTPGPRRRNLGAPKRNALRWRQLRIPDHLVQQQISAASEPPEVELGTPNWTGGSVALDAPQSEQLVNARVAEGEPSLLAGNIAVFSMDLSPAGATFMERTLLDPGGDGGTDLTPLQVRYDLTFWARLPPVNIHIEVDSRSVHRQLRKVIETEGHAACTPYDFAHSDVDVSTAHQAGLIDVQIDSGSAELDEEVIADLRDYALRLVEDMIESRFFADEPMDVDGGVDLGDQEDEGPTRKRFFRREYDRQSMHIQLDLEQRSVVQWPIRPQATLETFFGDMTADELRPFVRALDLNDTFFQHLGLEARVFTDFEDPEVQAVELELSYEGRDENGDRQEKSHHLTFTDSSTQRWNPSLIGGSREVDYRYRVSFAGTGFGPFSDRRSTTSSNLNVSIPAPGKIDLQVLAGDVDFENLVDQVQVQLAYEDPAAGVPREEHVLVLDASRPSARYQRRIGAFKARPVLFRRRFSLHSGRVIEDTDWLDAPGPQLVVNQPFEDLLQVRLLPTGTGWDTVTQVIVELRYDDPANGHHLQESLVLRSREELKVWRVVLRDPGLRSFDYRVIASFNNGDFEEGEWQLGRTETTVPIHIDAPPRLDIRLIPDRLDFETSPITEVTLSYDDAGVEESATFVFRDRTQELWRLAVPEGAPLDYSWQITYFPEDADPVVRPPVNEQDSVVVLPPYRPARAGSLRVQVLGQLLDFTATPLVVVDLFYDDDAHGVHEVGSLAFDKRETQTWEFRVADVEQKLFRVRITYFFADDREPQVVEPPPLLAPRVILQRPADP